MSILTLGGPAGVFRLYTIGLSETTGAAAAKRVTLCYALRMA